MTDAIGINRKSIRRAGGSIMNDDPTICVVDGFLNAEECAHFRELGDGRMGRAKVASGPQADVSDVRTNLNCWIDHQTTQTTRLVSNKIAKLVGIPRTHAEQFQLIHYPPTTEYQAHMDTFDPYRDEGKPYFVRGGQRLVTALAYLNDVEAGGGTEFPELGLSVSAKAGRLLIFFNCLAGSTTPNPRARHAGCPVQSGEKWAFNLWFREAPRSQTVLPAKGANTFTPEGTGRLAGMLMKGGRR